MNTGANFSEIFNQSGDVNELEKNVKEYPFSSLTRYMLLCHYKKNGHPEFESEAKRTALYFGNHHWLQFQLSQLQIESPESKIDPQNENSVRPDDGKKQDHFAVVTEEQFDGDQNNEGIIAGEEKIPETKSAESQLHSPSETEVSVNYETYANSIANEEAEIVPATETLGFHDHGLEGSQPYNNHEDHQYNQDKNSIPETQSLGSHDHLLGDAHAGHYGDNQENQSHEIKESHDVEQKHIGESTPPVNEPIAFEPMHTFDYFASQGIKITDEALSNDKLGTQMKSFTEWLKSMKKIHPDKIQGENSLAEDIIKSAAEVSNIDTEVLTEAMAEVLIKQDKKEKAIEMYNKLSLINPSKSAYFAAKIESIKST